MYRHGHEGLGDGQHMAAGSAQVAFGRPMSVRANGTGEMRDGQAAPMTGRMFAACASSDDEVNQFTSLGLANRGFFVELFKTHPRTRRLPLPLLASQWHLRPMPTADLLRLFRR